MFVGVRGRREGREAGRREGREAGRRKERSREEWVREKSQGGSKGRDGSDVGEIQWNYGGGI